jgi:hypothetical protein
VPADTNAGVDISSAAVQHDSRVPALGSAAWMTRIWDVKILHEW